MVGVVPVYMAYAFFGVVYFGNHIERFGNLTNAVITLFAVLNGDVVRDTYMTLLPLFPSVSQIYLYTFICLFMYVVLNVFIAIIEESFFTVRELRLHQHEHGRLDASGFDDLMERTKAQVDGYAAGTGASNRWEQLLVLADLMDLERYERKRAATTASVQEALLEGRGPEPIADDGDSSEPSGTEERPTDYRPLGDKVGDVLTPPTGDPTAILRSGPALRLSRPAGVDDDSKDSSADGDDGAAGGGGGGKSMRFITGGVDISGSSSSAAALGPLNLPLLCREMQARHRQQLAQLLDTVRRWSPRAVEHHRGSYLAEQLQTRLFERLTFELKSMLTEEGASEAE
eukprot:PLAT3630.5.p1 GENE.PLAT3630.5~~PLAT3630.5.p1  ORF type:complete len:352 (+),score=126.08 PLAT3630.5:28-1056(+)